MSAGIRAVLWDLGGVVFASPFEAFNRLEAERGLPRDFIRRVNSTNPHANAWARLERGELDPESFGSAFRAEAEALGHGIDGREVLGVIQGDVRPRMLAALRQVRSRYKTAAITNNMKFDRATEVAVSAERTRAAAEVMALFDLVVESSKAGVRKPEPAIYLYACEQLGVMPAECVFMDDLGVNLKPAAAMGMRTIKVVDPDRALAELGAIIDMHFP
ncbi:MAG: HAD-IA family hydrolase [Gammaproteobacteria bacterium]